MMTRVPAASVVIPVLNSREKLTRCLEALRCQKTTLAYEVIVVNDGSTEDLSAVRSAMGSRLPLVWLDLPGNSGPAVARNAGIEAARGDIILFTDADCRPEPDWLDQMVQPFRDPRVTGAKGVYLTDQRDAWARLAQTEFEERYELLNTCQDIDFVDTYSGAYRRGDLVAVKGFDTAFPRADNEDVDLAFRIKKRRGRFAFVPEAKVWHHHREGMWPYIKLKFWRGYWRMQVYRRHPEKAGRESYTPLTLKAQLLLLVVFPVTLFLTTRCRRWFYAWMVGWFTSCLPLMRRASSAGLGLTSRVPVFAAARGLALLAGMLWGMVRKA